MTALDAFLEALIVQACRAPNPLRPMTPNDLVDLVRQAKRRATPAEPAAIYDNVTPWLGPSEPATPEHWSPWLDWHGGPDAECPLPDAVLVLWEQSRSGLWDQACEWTWRQAGRFRYLAADPAGWLPRGDWIPPDILWRDDCPVRCEWRAADAGGVQSAGSCQPRNWHTITHIRLVARNLEEATQPEPAAVPELPEWARRPNRYGDYHVKMDDGICFWLPERYIDQIGELRDILAARRRAGL